MFVCLDFQLGGVRHPEDKHTYKQQHVSVNKSMLLSPFLQYSSSLAAGQQAQSGLSESVHLMASVPHCDCMQAHSASLGQVMVEA